MAREDARTDGGDDGGDAEPLLSLPPELRSALKDPMGPIETDAETLLERVDGPLIAVGDVVTYHFLEADRQPDVAVVDGRTKRREVDEEIRETVTSGASLEVTNPPADVTAALVRALLDALAAEKPTTILVEGEEDLAVLPAIVAAPDGATVVYGQPDEGMVRVRVTEEIRAEIRSLLEEFDGDYDRFRQLLGESDE